jgi:hypothetical protein
MRCESKIKYREGYVSHNARRVKGVVPLKYFRTPQLVGKCRVGILHGELQEVVRRTMEVQSGPEAGICVDWLLHVHIHSFIKRGQFIGKLGYYQLFKKDCVSWCKSVYFHGHQSYPGWYLNTSASCSCFESTACCFCTQLLGRTWNMLMSQ